MIATVQTRNPDAHNVIVLRLEVESLRVAKARFRHLAAAAPDLDIWMQVARDRREKNGIEHYHLIDRTNMH